MARFYANENFPRRAVQALRDMGHDVLTSLEAGRANQRIPDPEVLAFAVADSRAVLTLNRRDFIDLHNASADHAGIIVCTSDPDALALATRVHMAATQAALPGTLVRIVKPG